MTQKTSLIISYDDSRYTKDQIDTIKREFPDPDSIVTVPLGLVLTTPPSPPFVPDAGQLRINAVRLVLEWTRSGGDIVLSTEKLLEEAEKIHGFISRK